MTLASCKQPRKFASNSLGVPILLGDRAKIKANAEKLNINLEHIRIIELRRSDGKTLSKISRLAFQNLKNKDIEQYLDDTNYFATIMLATRRLMRSYQVPPVPPPVHYAPPANRPATPRLTHRLLAQHLRS